jgi:hypothetical protein
MEFSMAFDPTAASLGQEIDKAKEALLSKSQEARGEWLSARELKASARSGWSRGVANLALSRLIEDGTLDLKEGKVRLSK